MTEDFFQFDSADEQATATLGRALEAALPPRCVVGLDGPLGAGKTRLVQATAAASGIDRRDVTSPTFVLVQEYHGRRTIYHVDAYRLAGVDEFLALGVDEHFEEDCLVLVEWAERVAAALPRERIDIRIHVIGDEERRFEVRAIGGAYKDVLAALRQQLATG
jgi:tRNA threonylcarbamoyladenosine biosynthesis protein TsaE